MLPVAILAGGLASRLRPVTETIPKILVEIEARPFAEYQLDWLRSQGVTHVVYCLGYRADQVVQALGDGRRWGMRFDFVTDGPTLLGTGGALRRALPHLGDECFVLYGDSLLTCDLAPIERAYRESGRACLMTVFRNENRWDRSNIVFRDGRIVVYDKQRHSADMTHIDYGLGIVAGRVLLAYPPDVPFDLARVYRDQLETGELAGYEVGTRFYEIGSPAGLEETRAYLKRKAAGR